MSEENQNTDSSQAIIRLLTVLVAILGLLLVTFMIATGILIYAYVNTNGAAVAKTEPVIELPAAEELKSRPSGDSGTVPVEPVQSSPPIDVVASEGVTRPLEALPEDFAVSIANSEPAWRYKLTGGEPMVFDYSSVVSVENTELSNKGRVTYKLLEDDPVEYLRDVYDQISEESDEDAKPFSLSGNGTGFVVHPEGLVVTCAHVVEDVKEVVVKLQDRDFVGKVIAVDAKHDLALIKVSSDEPLRYLPFVQSVPKLGTAARVFGFPLTDKLGGSMKLTTGTVTGIDDVYKDSPRLQLDATANPGNSGGPVTDNTGAVLGVVDSILAGVQVSDMSFAVPAKQLRQMLDQYKIPFRIADSGVKDQLAVSSLEDVNQAVAMIEVSGEKTGKSWKVLSVLVSDRQTTTQKNRRMLFNGRLPGETTTTRGRLLVDTRGKVIYCSESRILPLVVQDLATIGFIELPRSNAPRWTAENRLLMKSETRERESDGRSSPFGMHHDLHRHMMPRHYGSPFGSMSPFGGSRGGREVTRQTLRAVEVKDEFEVSSDESELRIGQRRKVVTRDLGEGAEKQSTVLRGKSVFSPTLGMAENGNLKGKLKIRVDGENLTGDIVYSFKRISKEAIVEEKRARRERTAELKRKKEAAEKVQQEKFAELDFLSDGKVGFAMWQVEEPVKKVKAEAEGEEPNPFKEEVTSPRLFCKIPKSNHRGNVAISPDANRIAVADHRSLKVYQLNEGAEEYDLLATHSPAPDRNSGEKFLKFSADGNRLVASGSFNRTSVLEIDGKEINEVAFFSKGGIFGVDKSLQNIAFFSRRENRLDVFDVDSGSSIFDLKDQLYPTPVTDLYFADDGRLLIAQGSRATLVDLGSQAVIETTRWPIRGSGTTRIAGGGRFVLAPEKGFEIKTGKEFDLPRHTDCFGLSGDGKWFVHVPKTFDKTIQFNHLDGEGNYRLDVGSRTGHWEKFDLAVTRNRMVAFELFSDHIYVIDYP